MYGGQNQEYARRLIKSGQNIVPACFAKGNVAPSAGGGAAGGLFESSAADKQFRLDKRRKARRESVWR